jgi:hypothetical protein
VAIVRSPFDLYERSVAADASRRLGKVACEITEEEPEICLGCVWSTELESAGTVPGPAANLRGLRPKETVSSQIPSNQEDFLPLFLSINQSLKPQS